MAHVKVVRRSMRPEDGLTFVLYGCAQAFMKRNLKLQILKFAMPDRFQKINTNIILMNIVQD